MGYDGWVIGKIKSYLFGSIFRRGASILTFLTLAAYVLGLVRDRLFAHAFGAARLLDIYNAAFIIPDTLLNIFIASALTAAFVPIFTHLRAQRQEAEADRVATTMLAAAPVAMGGIALIALIFMPYLAHLVAPGFDGADLALLIHLSRLMLLSPIIFAVSNTLGNILISHERFIAYGLSPIFYNGGIITGIFLVPIFGPLGLVIGTLIGAGLHLTVRIIDVALSSFRLRGPVDLRNPHFWQVLKLMIPRMAGQPIEQLTFLVFTSMASTLAAGSIVILNFARDFQSVPVSIFGISFATAVFASLSHKAATRDREGFLRHFRETAKALAVVTTLAMLFYIFFSRYMIAILLGGGKFGPDQVHQMAVMLGWFALSIPAESFIHLLVRSFYALKDTWTPILISVPGLAIIYILARLLLPSLGLNALAIAYSAAQAIEALVLWLLLSRRLKAFQS